MFQQKQLRRAVLLALYGSAALTLSPSASAQTAPPDAAQAEAVQSVRVVGTRRVGASSATDTPVPVDIIPMTRLAEQGSQFDLAQTLTKDRKSVV